MTQETKGDESPQVSVSVCLVALELVRELRREEAAAQGGIRENVEVADQIMSSLLPWALHHRHAVRVPVQVREGRIKLTIGDRPQG